MPFQGLKSHISKAARSRAPHRARHQSATLSTSLVILIIWEGSVKNLPSLTGAVSRPVSDLRDMETDDGESGAALSVFVCPVPGRNS